MTTAEAPATAELPLLTVSAKRCFQRCAREYRFAYEDGYRPLESDGPRRFGTLFHAGLEGWWLAAKAGEDRLAGAFLRLLAAAAQKPDPFEMVRAEELLRGYDARWGSEHLEVLAVEAEFTAPLVNPESGAASRTWQMAGKLDAIVRTADGHVLTVEHKTSSEDISQGSEYWRRLQLDHQVSDYFVGARALGFNPDGCLYDVIGKPMLRPGEVPILDEDGVKIVLDATGQRVRTKDGKKFRETGDTALGYELQKRPELPDEFRARIVEAIVSDPDRYYQRGPVVRLDDEERDAAFDGWQLGRLIREAQLAARWPRRVDSCVSYGRTCDYFGVCTKTASLDDPMLFRRSERAHEELSLSPSNGAAP